MVDPAPRVTIVEDPSASSGEKDRNPIDPAPRETHVAKEIHEERPTDCVKGFSNIDL
jgi:hypothetical protein